MLRHPRGQRPDVTNREGHRTDAGVRPASVGVCPAVRLLETGKLCIVIDRNWNAQ